MLSDQDFTSRPVVLVGPEFFMDEELESPRLDLALTMGQERLQQSYEFLYCWQKGELGDTVRRTLDNWGTNVVTGQCFSGVNFKEDYKRVLRIVSSPSVIAVHCLSLADKYRVSRHKRYDVIPPDEFLDILFSETSSPSSSSLMLALAEARDRHER